MTAAVTYINIDRGFGFIVPMSGDTNIFFAARNVEGIAFEALRRGDFVTFDMGGDAKGRVNAINVRLARRGMTVGLRNDETGERLRIRTTDWSRFSRVVRRRRFSKTAQEAA